MQMQEDRLGGTGPPGDPRFIRRRRRTRLLAVLLVTLGLLALPAVPFGDAVPDEVVQVVDAAVPDTLATAANAAVPDAARDLLSEPQAEAWWSPPGGWDCAWALAGLVKFIANGPGGWFLKIAHWVARNATKISGSSWNWVVKVLGRFVGYYKVYNVWNKCTN